MIITLEGKTISIGDQLDISTDDTDEDLIKITIYNRNLRSMDIYIDRTDLIRTLIALGERDVE